MDKLAYTQGMSLALEMFGIAKTAGGPGGVV